MDRLTVRHGNRAGLDVLIHNDIVCVQLRAKGPSARAEASRNEKQRETIAARTVPSPVTLKISLKLARHMMKLNSLLSARTVSIMSMLPA